MAKFGKIEKLLSTKEAAEYLGISQYRIRFMRMRVNQNKFNFPKGIKIGSTFKYEKAEIDKWLQTCKVI
ncbi:helix-turn-helix transcriptional regulator [Campylobacter jejuni]|uniref:helix-turn-helix transcriptional regulator n=1 Tax=Campylobacter jejuni TaxID=197 RepID=UPI000F80E992|nr:helix-turn-helix domain-containing protein [Campylobacter jejuni]RTJ01902.1 DNA-binding protein [Campylobacter jejuni]RTJ06796.1 DNA-binding protein [Campylobacter jejuni]RTJ77581.1 DNA-binding protein [Campylobacter jejuni]